MTAILGLDPGLAHFGWAVVDVRTDSMAIVDLGVIVTVPESKKRGTYVADDNVRRARELHSNLKNIMGYRPSVVCAEMMSHPRMASSAAKLAMSWGVLASFLSSMPLCCETPQGIKKALTGNRSASKEDVGAALTERWPGLPELLLAKGIAKTNREHAWDALAAIVACQGAEVMRLARGAAMRGAA